MADERYIDGPPEGADAWRQVWDEDRRYRPRGGGRELFLRGARSIVRRSLSPDNDRQKDFNVALLDLIRDLRQDLETLRHDLKRDIAAVQIDVRMADEALAAEIASLRELIPLAARRNDALIAALDQKIETVAVRIRDLLNEPAGESIGEPAGESAGSSIRTRAASSDFLYRRLEDGLRGTAAEVRDAMRPYVELARDASPVVDVGCGRGEFLIMCGEEGIEAWGYDTNERSVADLRQRGLRVEVGSVPECLEGAESVSIGSILATHVVEHLPADSLFALFRESARVLRPGGLLMIETPNAESILVGASEFWRDPTHIAPRHPAALTLLGREHGFSVEDVRAVHPFPDGSRIKTSAGDPPELQRALHAINDRLFAPQDLRLILRKA